MAVEGKGERKGRRRGDGRGATFYCYGAQPREPVSPTTPRLSFLSFRLSLLLCLSPSASLIRYSSWNRGACSWCIKCPLQWSQSTVVPIRCSELSNQGRFDDGGQKFGINSMRDAARRIDTIDRSIDRSIDWSIRRSAIRRRPWIARIAKVDHLSWSANLKAKAFSNERRSTTLSENVPRGINRWVANKTCLINTAKNRAEKTSVRFHKTAKIMSRNLSISCNSFLLSSQHNGKTRVSAHARLPFEKGHMLPAPRGKSFLTLLRWTLTRQKNTIKTIAKSS